MLRSFRTVRPRGGPRRPCPDTRRRPGSGSSALSPSGADGDVARERRSTPEYIDVRSEWSRNRRRLQPAKRSDMVPAWYDLDGRRISPMRAVARLVGTDRTSAVGSLLVVSGLLLLGYSGGMYWDLLPGSRVSVPRP